MLTSFPPGTLVLMTFNLQFWFPGVINGQDETREEYQVFSFCRRKVFDIFSGNVRPMTRPEEKIYVANYWSGLTVKLADGRSGVVVADQWSQRDDEVLLEIRLDDGTRLFDQRRSTIMITGHINAGE